MDLRLEQVLAAARARRAALTAETAGYIALGVADALAVAPGVVRDTDVILDADGNVTVSGAQRADDPSAAERSVRSLLQKLLSASAGSSPSLSACSRRQSGNGMRALIEELEAALIPVNRAAARRAIARLAREASRAPGLASEPPRPARVVRESPAAPAPAPEPAPPAAAQPVPRPATDLFEAATEPEYTEQLDVAAPEPSVQQPVDTTPTELSTLEVSEHTAPLELIPAEATPGPAPIVDEPLPGPAVQPPVPPAVPDLEVGPIVRRPSPFLETSPVPPTPAPPTPAPPTPAPPTPAPPTPAPPTPAPLRADPHGLTPQLSTYDPHTAARLPEVPPPPPASETPAWDGSYAERDRVPQPPRVVSAVQPGERRVETAQPPEVVLAAARPVPPEVSHAPEPSVPIDLIMNATPPPAMAEVPEPSVPIDLIMNATPPPAMAEVPEPSVPIDVVMSATPPPAQARGTQPPAPADPESATPPPALDDAAEPSLPLEIVAPPTPAPPTPAPPTPAPPTPEAAPAAVKDEAPEAPKADQDGVGGVQVSAVDDLLANFSAGARRSPREVAGELKKMVGLEPTPAPPEVATLTASSLASLPDDEERGAPMAPLEFRRPRAPRTSLAITTTLLVLMVGVAAALYWFYPQLFTGR